jgi:hypothetical protein
MRRAFIGLFGVVAALGFSLLPSQPAQGQFMTNTPEGGAPQSTPLAATALPTSAPISQATSVPTTSAGIGLGFSTNTPEGPQPSPTTAATSVPTATITPSATPEPIGPFTYPDNYNSLTGMPYPDEASRARVNLLVKISNYPPIVRPQTGINKADVVYEYEAEGGVTRFAAIFRSQMPELVGSIRSGRLMDMELLTMYRANLAYSGTSEPIQKLFLSNYPYRLISPFIGDAQGDGEAGCAENPYCRIPQEGKAFEHTLFGNTRLMWDVANMRGTNKGYKAKGFAFSDVPEADGEPVNDIYIDWYGQTDARWQYDEATGRYVRFTDGQPHFDKGDGEQVWADNLVVIVVPHDDFPDIFPEGANYISVEVQLWHPEETFLYQALVLRDGQLYQGYWDRPNKEEGTALFLMRGNNQPIPLKPGRTWVSVVRGLGDVTWSEVKEDVYATATIQALTPSPTPLNLQEGD